MSARDGRHTDRGAAALDFLSVLYPSPFSARTGSAGLPGARAWTALPSPGNPRLLLPVVGRSAQAQMLRPQITSPFRTRVARAGLSLATTSGALGRVPGLRVTVTGPDDALSIEDLLRELLGVDQLWLTVRIGPPRSNRKPVLQVTDASGRPLAFAKVGHNPLTRRLVSHEADTLRRLEGVQLRHVRAPALIASAHWSSCEVVVLEPLVIPRQTLTGRPGRRRLLEVVHELASVGGRSDIEWQHHPHRAALLSRIELCGAQGEPLRRQVERIADRMRLATGSWHGDLNPGNLALVPGACPVWDWERFEPAVPVGFDLLHHDLHASITVKGVAADIAATRLVADAARTLAPLGVNRAAADAVARAYLVTLASRYLLDDQCGAGGGLGRVQEWLLPTLEVAGT